MGWTELKNTIHRVNYYVAFAGMSLLIPMMLLTAGDVIGRGFFRKPIPGTFELSEYILAVFILLGAAYTQQVKGHVGVDFLTSRLPFRARTTCETLTTVLSLFIIGIVVWMGWSEGIRERAVSDMLRIPQFPFRLLVSVGGFLLWLELWIDLIETVGRLRRGES